MQEIKPPIKISRYIIRNGTTYERTDLGWKKYQPEITETNDWIEAMKRNAKEPVREPVSSVKQIINFFNRIPVEYKKHGGYMNIIKIIRLSWRKRF